MSSSSVGWKRNPAGRFRFGTAATLQQLLLLRLGLGLDMAAAAMENQLSMADWEWPTDSTDKRSLESSGGETTVRELERERERISNS